MENEIVLKKLNMTFWPLGWGSAGHVFATMLLHFIISFNLLCNMTISEKLEFCPFDPIL